jgi:hypothetical protein
VKGTASATSNSTNFTLTAPFSKKTAYLAMTIARSTDNGSTVGTLGCTYINGGSNILQTEKSIGSTSAWTASGTKDVYFEIMYEI